MTTLPKLERRVEYLFSVLKGLKQEVCSNSGGVGTETDPVFTASPSYSITGQNITDWGNSFTNSHTHSNKAVLDGITSGLITNWNTAFTNNHTHANKAFLDALPAGSASNQYLTYNGTVYSWNTIPTVPTNADYVDRTTAQSVGGVKTFTGTPIFTAGATPATNGGSTLGSSSLAFSNTFTQSITGAADIRVLNGTGRTIFSQTADANTVVSIANNGNTVFQAPGAIPSTGFRLDVRGTSRFSGDMSINNTSALQVFGTTDETTNFERVRLRWDGTKYILGTDQGGTGTTRDISIYVGASIGLNFSNAGSIKQEFIVTGNSSLTTEMFKFNHAGALTSTSLNHKLVSITPSINQTSGTGGYTGLYMSVYEQAILGSGTKEFLNFGVNTAQSGGGTHTSRFRITNTGNVFASGDIEMAATKGPIIVDTVTGVKKRITSQNNVLTFVDVP